MDGITSALAGYWWIVVVLGVLLFILLFWKLIFKLFGVWIIPSDSVGVVNKKFVLFGNHRRLPGGSIIALQGEAGIQADTLAPGLHFGLWPWQYSIRIVKFFTIPEGKLGVVEAKDGQPLPAGRILGKKVSCSLFQDARAFLVNGGERGPQNQVIPPGVYRLNPELFTVTLYDVTDVTDNVVGIITTKEGKPLETGEIAGPEIAGHNSYQDAQAFIDNGGYKGRQVQVILAGRYYINPKFATVETKPYTEVPIAHAGVVISYVGEKGQDVTGENFKHGNLVHEGQKGVWIEPKDPGKFPINTVTHKVENVPTANIVLNWATGRNESHMLDANLSTITVRSADGFTFNLDVSQIIHIPRNDAPKVIAQFGSVQNLVTQVLEPMIANYFRNAAQGSDAIDFLKSRQERQADAKAKIETELAKYGVNAIDTLIGDIVPPPELMKTLTDRKIAEQEKTTYQVQMQAEQNRKQLQQAKAQADTQANVVNAEREVEIAKFNADAMINKANGDAQSKTINAKADAEVTKVNGEAIAQRTLAIGDAEAKVIEQKAKAQGLGNYALVEVSKNLAASKQALVPNILAGGAGQDANSGAFMNIFMAMLLKEKIEGLPPMNLNETEVSATEEIKTETPATENSVKEPTVVEAKENNPTRSTKK